MSFNETDAKGVKQPHNDPLVIMLNIEGFNTKRILMDNGSSADIIYLPAFQQLKLDLTVGTYSRQLTRQLDFLVVNYPSSYNVIIGRPTLNK